MKKAILFLLLLATMPMQTTAQVNPQKGYVITNGNDTVHGTIDYLTDARNAKACLFQEKGEDGYKSLSPTDIRGYRLADDGIYYVSRMFNGGEKPSGSTQDEVLFAGQTDYLLGGSLVVKDGSIDKELSRQTRRIKMFWKVSNQSTRPLFPVPPFRHLLVSMTPRTSRRQHTGHNLSSSIQPVFPAWWRIIGPQPYGCQVEGNSCPDNLPIPS